MVYSPLNSQHKQAFGLVVVVRAKGVPRPQVTRSNSCYSLKRSFFFFFFCFKNQNSGSWYSHFIEA